MSSVFLGPDYDQSKVNPDLSKIKTYLILSSPRSGSTLLCSLLYNVAGHGVPYEYFNKPINMARRFGVTDTPKKYESIDMTRYIRALVENRTTPHNLVWGAKLFPPHIQWMLESDLGLRLLKTSKILRLRREDKLEQAISYSIAAQTGEWNSTSPKKGIAPVLKGRHVLKILHRLLEQDLFWDLLIDKYDLHNQVLTVTYERVKSDTQAVCEKIMHHLTGDPTGFHFSLSPEAVTVQSQATTQKEDFRKQFLGRMSFSKAEGLAAKLLVS